MTRRETVDVGGVPISYLAAGELGPLVLLLHGTYWSRIWQPVLDGIAAAGLRPVAVDFPGFGRSGGELTASEASVPRLSAWLLRFLDALGHTGPVMVAGHDIGGGVAQHLMLTNKVEVQRLAVVNGVMYDSWPVPGVARFRDPAVAAATTRDDVLAARRVSVVKALGRPASEVEIAEYLDPWTDPRVSRSWLALAGASDNRYTMEMLPALLQSKTPKLLVWGEDDGFQTVDFAERYAREIPETRLVRIKSAGHIPMENDAKAVAGALAEFFAADHPFRKPDNVLATPHIGYVAEDLYRTFYGDAADGIAKWLASMRLSVTVNGHARTIMVEPRMTLLDALREELALTGTKKGCDRGECGACTVHVEGRRVLSCMTLAAMQDGKRIITIEGLEHDGMLHPLQAAFIEHDGFQCGFCTSGQIMSGVAVIEEAKAGWPSAATADVTKPFALSDLSSAEIRERMSGNLCRCACYPNIVDAVADATGRS